MQQFIWIYCVVWKNMSKGDIFPFKNDLKTLRISVVF